MTDSDKPATGYHTIDMGGEDDAAIDITIGDGVYLHRTSGYSGHLDPGTGELVTRDHYDVTFLPPREIAPTKAKK